MAAPALEASGTNSLDPDLRADLIIAAMGGVPDSRDARVALTAIHPLTFALTYLPRHITDAEGRISFADMHLDVAQLAAHEWRTPNAIKQGRDAFIAPRECGKSSWLFTILPLWAAAHGYARFIAAFSDTAEQARRHLMTFKRELETNDLLRQDFPRLCTAARRHAGNTVSDRQDLYMASSGFSFIAMGIDGPAHGLKIGDARPDLVILDDVSGGVGNVTLHEETQRLETLQGSILYLNQAARVLLAGTTTLNGGIIHQLVQGKEEWIAAENLRVHYYPALYRDETGQSRSTWPVKWSVEWLEQERRVSPREFARNMQNQPVPINSAYWTREDFHYGRLATASKCVIAVDPAVTTRRSSDETGVAVVSFSVAERKACVEYVTGVRMKGEPLRRLVLDLIARYPQVTEVVAERNQGGEMMIESVFHTLPVPIVTIHNTAKKEIRFERVLSLYRRGQVLHAQRMHDLEQQMLETPNSLHDDKVDAVAIAIEHLAAATRQRQSRLLTTVR